MTQNTFTQPSLIPSQRSKGAVNQENKKSADKRPFIVSRSTHTLPEKRQVSLTASWTNFQKEKYSIFVCYFRQFLKSQNPDQIPWTIFKAMSKYVQTRNPQQCRSYHMKLIQEFKAIENFILIISKRFPFLKEKIMNVEQKLEQIQNQFNLFIIQSQEEKLNMYLAKGNLSQNVGSMGSANIVQNNLWNEKRQKEDFIKTADSYADQQNPVKLNYQNTFFSSRSEFKPFDGFKSKFNKPSLPNFNEELQQRVQIKQQHKASPFLSKNDFGAQLLFPTVGQSLKNIQNFGNSSKLQDKGISQFQGPSQNMQKMKDFLECHYLFQLWTSKLQKIMRS